MKIALVHDYLKEYGGAERVLMTLHNIWPKAPIYTAFLDKGSTAGKEFKKAEVIESFLAPLIKKKNLYSPLRFLAPIIWKSFDLSSFDVVITSASWYITRGFRVSDKTRIICYCHTPPRYLYGFETSVEWQRYWPVRVYALIVNHFLRMFDFNSAQSVDYFIVNSKNVQKRVKKFYRRDSTIIYPPVEVKEIIRQTKNSKSKDYFLIASRVVGAKGIEIAIEAAKKAKIPLKIIGEPAGLRFLTKNIKEMENEFVEFLGRVSDRDLYKAYGECKAFLALAKDEDFGMTPVEAMAAGRPVIAFRGGGYLETVVDKKTGLFFDSLKPEALSRILKEFDEKKYKPENCRDQAQKFSKERFVKEIGEFVKKNTQDNAGITRN
ncbi:MAG: glycosyltransferase [Patescibacteria group bacterium]|nr:glycosyltransferase [Patescibacteria group bacterium]